MSRTKRKTTKRKSYKSKKKRKHLNTGAFFIIVIGILLVATIYYFYQHEQEKKKPVVAQQQTEKSTIPDKPAGKSRPKPQEKKTPAKAAPSIPRIIDYTDLEYPVSYSSQPEQIIFHTGHTVSYNKNWKIPNWVSYELTIDETMGEEKRHDKFIPDPFIKEGTVTTGDYRNSGYDRGHMAPAADLKWSNASMKESFYLSNICPQHPKLNQRRWKDLENKVREWAIADSAIIVICGPIVNNSPKCIGINKVAVPHGFFKVILSPFKESPKAIGFIFDNEHCTAPLHSHVVSIDSVEVVTGLDFFSPLPDEVEDLLEAYVDTAYWGL
ncbi:DNA/RNA non-specific endonuclease [Bacteroides sp. 51]|uniref:DNA/RNA non-specific endonuclease n=1 Tax=Bacteroides sp. 51 TaxID=2302938 RepID=UPI0013D2FE8A|nr:DNA/RNA non-specific endonuclease [Bacteroides sp. 51]NDV81403.1 DNA/RNA non-specific endonuclease [Bacteroides sp. 51]